jgi:hypothetical protein
MVGEAVREWRSSKGARVPGKATVALPYASEGSSEFVSGGSSHGASSIGPVGPGFFGARVGLDIEVFILLRGRRSERAIRTERELGGREKRFGKSLVTEVSVVAVEPMRLMRECEESRRAGNGTNPVRLGCNIPRTVLEPEPPRC